MTITRLLGIAFGLALVLRLCMPLFAVFKPQLRQTLQQLQLVIDVAGGLILLIIAGSVWWRGRPDVALLVLLLGIPVFIGAWRALPAWWYGHK
jgi:hypothetical protein